MIYDVWSQQFTPTAKTDIPIRRSGSGEVIARMYFCYLYLLFAFTTFFLRWRKILMGNI